MACLTEFTCSVFADGELPENEIPQVEEHLESCVPCREMVAAFRNENRLLVHCFQGIDWQDSAPAMAASRQVVPSSAVRPAARPVAARPMDVAKVGGMLAGVAALIRLAMSSPENFALPASPVSLDWLDPSNLSGSLNWFGGAVSFVTSEGVSRMALLMDGLSVVALFALIFGGLAMLVRRSVGKGALVSTLSTLASIVLIVTCATSSYAMDIRKGKSDAVLVIPASETVDDSLFAAAETVIIDGTVNGDLITFARSITINGTVKGNVVSAAQSIEVHGTVGGTIAAAAQTLQINGRNSGNVFGFAQTINMGKEFNTGGDVIAFSGDTHANGAIARSLYAVGMADIAGSVGRNVDFSGGTLSVFPAAHIMGNLTSKVQKAESIHIAPGAVIEGKQTVDIIKPRPSKYGTLAFYFSTVLGLAAAFTTGFIFLLVFPRLRHARFDEAAAVLKSGGVGFLAMVSMPIAAFIVAITIIGFPVALVGIVAWLLGLYLAKIVVANFVGRTLFSSENDRLSAMALHLFVGLVLVVVAINLPYIGGLLHFFLVLIGFGALVMNVYDAFRPMDFAADSGK